MVYENEDKERVYDIGRRMFYGMMFYISSDRSASNKYINISDITRFFDKIGYYGHRGISFVYDKIFPVTQDWPLWELELEGIPVLWGIYD